MSFEVYLTDLKKAVQKEILRYYGYKDIEETNYEDMPLFILERCIE